MPVSFLSGDQAFRYGRFSGPPTSEQLARYFHLDDADRAFIGTHRGDHNRLGVAVQLGSLRLLGAFLEDPSQIPASVARFAGAQLAIDGTAELMARYCASKGRWRHGPRIRDHYGYCGFSDPGVAFRLHRFIYALCWTGTDRPSALFDAAATWLLEAKVLLPGLSVLERDVARVRTRVQAHVHRRLVDKLTPEQRALLDTLVAVPEDGRQSPLDRQRDGPYLQSGPEISRAVDRLTEIRTFTAGLPELDRVPPGKAAALARFAGAARAQAVARLPDDRRAATLVAFIRTLEASASDDVVDLFDVVSTRMFSNTRINAKQARMRSLRDLDAASLKLRDVGAVVLDDSIGDAEVRAAVFAVVDRAALADAVDQVTCSRGRTMRAISPSFASRPAPCAIFPRCLRGWTLPPRPRGSRCSTRSTICAGSTRVRSGVDRCLRRSRPRPGPGSSRPKTARST